MSLSDDDAALLASVNKHTTRVYSLIKDLPVVVQGVVLADIAAIWIAAHPRDSHDGLFKLQVTSMEKFLRFYARMMRERGKVEADTDKL